MGRQFRVIRPVSVEPIVANQPITVDLPRDYDYEAIHVRVYGQVNVTAAATSVRAEAPTQAVKRFEVVADGRNTLHSAPGWYSVLARYDRNMRIPGSRAVTPPSAAGIAVYDFEALAVLDMQTVDGERPKDSNFRSAGLQLFQLRTTFGAALDMFVPGAGAATFQNAFIEISVQQLVEVPDTGTGAVSMPSFLRKVSSQEINVIASNSNAILRLPAGNLIKSNVIRTEGLATAGEPTTAMLSQVQMGAGVDIRHKSTGPALRGMNNANYGPVTNGYYVLDVTRNGSDFGRLSELWDVTQQSEPQFNLDVVGGANGRLQCVTVEYIPITR
jgi:hypothetical protein